MSAKELTGSAPGITSGKIEVTVSEILNSNSYVIGKQILTLKTGGNYAKSTYISRCLC